MFCCATQTLNVNKFFESKSSCLSIKGKEMGISPHSYEHAAKVVKELKSCSIPLWILFSLISDFVLMPHKRARSQANILYTNTFCFWVTLIEGISFGCQKKICSCFSLKFSSFMQKSWCPSRAVRSCTKTYFNVISKDLSKDKGTFQSICCLLHGLYSSGSYKSQRLGLFYPNKVTTYTRHSL